MKRIALTLLGLTAACGGAESPATSAPVDAAADVVADVYVDPYAKQCANDTSVPPMSLVCTGLYTDILTKTVAPGIQSYAPAVPLWADYASKERWIYLPPGTKIDASDPTEWLFPIGTKVWKEFSRDNKRVETRLFQKLLSDYWVYTTYAWNDDETEATLSSGGNIPWGTDGGFYHIPTPDECDQCHRGRTDHILGFEQVSLGLPGATGLTLEKIVAQQLIMPVPALTTLTVGDDGTGLAAAPLKWLHINCGTTCHNDNPNATASGASMRLRLDPTLLDGRSSAAFPSRVTTLGIAATTPAWLGLTRIEPGDPSHSLLVELISNRGTDNPVGNQMPPIATYVVDTADVATVTAWIAKMPAPPETDAGSDAGMTGVSDGGVDATATVIGDAGVDASPGNDSGPDATVTGSEAGTDASPDANADEGAADAGDATSDAGAATEDAASDAEPDTLTTED
jgi:hypothetical protein